MKYKCPVCQNELIKENKSYICLNKHLFDISKEGYVNLLKKQGNKEFGDSVEMVKARREFFLKDYYHPLKERLMNIIKDINPQNLLDLGCGEGYYTNYFKDHLDFEIVGMDISKEAVKLASKQNKQTQYFVGSVQDIPIFDHEFEMVSNFFTPLDLKEIKRVLIDEGYLLCAKVSKNHLIELKKAIYDDVYLNDNEPIKDEQLELIHNEVVNFKIIIDNNQDLINLFQMTPYSHHTSLESKERLKRINYLEVTVSIDIELYRYHSDN